MYTPIVVTQDNLTWAVNENWRLIYEELRYKVPMNGAVQLKGDWDFQNLYTIRGIMSDGPNTAIPNAERAT